MAFNNGDGLTAETAYEVETVANLNELNDYPGAFFKLVNNIDVANAGIQFFNNSGAEFDFNGFSVLNVGNFLEGASDQSSYLRDGLIKNGKLNVSVTRSTGDIFIVSGINICTMQEMTISGKLTNTGTGKAATIQRFSSSFVIENNKFLLDLEGNGIISGGSTETTQTPTSIKRNLYLGNLIDNGSGTSTFYGFSVSTTSRPEITSNVYDSTKNPVVSDSVVVALPITTTESRQLSTYRNIESGKAIGKRGVGTISGSQGTNQVNGSNTQFNLAYVQAGMRIRVGIGTGSEIYQIQSISDATSLTLTANISTTFTDEDFYIISDSNQVDEVFDMVALSSYVDETWAIDDGNAIPELSWEVDPAQYVSGIVSYDSSPVEGATVDVISVDQVGGTETLEEAGLVTIADGSFTSTVARNSAKDYYAKVYPFNLAITGLTGTVTVTDSTNLDLGVDISSLDTGQSKAYTIRATGGTGNGEVIVITGYTDKVNGLVTVSYHPFGNDTTFEICRVIGAKETTILPRLS